MCGTASLGRVGQMGADGGEEKWQNLWYICELLVRMSKAERGTVLQLGDAYRLDEEDKKTPKQADPGGALQDQGQINILQRHGAYHQRSTGGEHLREAGVRCQTGGRNY